MVPPNACWELKDLSSDTKPLSSLDQERAYWWSPGRGSWGQALWTPSSAGCPWPSVDILSCSWSEIAWVSLLDGVTSPTPIGHLTSEFWMTCTCPEGSAKPVQTLLGEPLLVSLHYRLAPLGGPAFFLSVKGFPLCWLGYLSEERSASLLRLEKFSGSVGSVGHSERTPFLLGWLEGPTSGVPTTWKPSCLRCWFLRNFEERSQASEGIWCCCCMVKIFASNSLMLGLKRFWPWNGAVLALATWWSLSLRLPKATSRLINCRLEATATAEATPFLDALAMILTCSWMILTCSWMILVLFSSGMYSSSDASKESVMEL